MPRRCNCTGRCSCVIQEGANVTITGAGTPEDPLIIAAADAGESDSGWLAGDLKWTSRPSAPAGWLVADGTPVSRTTYAVLWAALGSPDTGDGTTTFNLPDFTGRFMLGRDGSHPLGSVGGAEEVVLNAAQIAGHTHTATAAGAHSHELDLSTHVGDTGANVPLGTASKNRQSDAAVEANGGHSHPVAKNQTGPADPVSILPPYSAALPLIKT